VLHAHASVYEILWSTEFMSQQRVIGPCIRQLLSKKQMEGVKTISRLRHQNWFNLSAGAKNVIASYLYTSTCPMEA
jgi:hypothetical protein